MISGDDVRRFFQDKLAKPGAYGGGPTSLQIFRGISSLLWEGQHPAGCFRHFTIFNNFGAIPEYCFECCKVLIQPRTVVELFKLLMVFEKLTLPSDNTRKCMCETREFCSGAYKGFIYCRGAEATKEVFDIVRTVVSDEISPDISITVKRGCSEFERAFPGFDRIAPGDVWMKYNENWKAHEDFVDNNASFKAPDANDRDIAPYNASEVFATHFWLSYAATIGDMSFKEVTGFDVPLIPQLRRPPFTHTTNSMGQSNSRAKGS